MKVTDVKIYMEDNNKLKAFATITIDNSFVVRGLKIIEGTKGRFVAMPSMKKKDGTYQDIAHPINNDARMMIEQEVFKAYEEALKNPQHHITVEEDTTEA